MKLAKTIAIAFATSALLAGPVLAQGMAPQGQTRGGTTMQQGAPSGSADEELNAQPGASTDKAGATTKSGTKGTVGSASGAHKATGSTSSSGTKKY
ncbi:hypothetical protein IC762_06645 [Bradyrhizobium genosp. L]|uniref:hypothetical protein n=1 Tax=Bradyrhizobium genosp. L TaxID=83637 RepID=UPI0018A2CA62|nr:hypothetical protein [Bradyrhizobium genosp. L]QPF85979.1 hypothetical protein IC762_06645 [Bradyrhizobium genosp. L]